MDNWYAHWLQALHEALLIPRQCGRQAKEKSDLTYQPYPWLQLIIKRNKKHDILNHRSLAHSLLWFAHSQIVHTCVTLSFVCPHLFLLKKSTYRLWVSPPKAFLEFRLDLTGTYPSSASIEPPHNNVRIISSSQPFNMEDGLKLMYLNWCWMEAQTRKKVSMLWRQFRWTAVHTMRLHLKICNLTAWSWYSLKAKFPPLHS